MSAFKVAKATSLARSRPKYFICVICIVILCAAALIANMMLESRYADMRTETVRRLTEQVQPKAAQLSLLSANIKNQVRYLCNSDLIRLFTYELFTAPKDEVPETSASTAHAPTANDADSGEDGIDSAEPETKAAQLKQQLPGMRRLLANFVREHAAFQTSLLVSSQEIFLSNLIKPPALSEAQMQAARNVFESGTPLFLPLYRDEAGRLVSDLLYPISSPLYMADKDFL